MQSEPVHMVDTPLAELSELAWRAFGRRQRGLACPLCGKTVRSHWMAHADWLSAFRGHIRTHHWGNTEELRALLIQLAMEPE
jgi:hypothetical protein